MYYGKATDMDTILVVVPRKICTNYGKKSEESGRMASKVVTEIEKSKLNPSIRHVLRKQ